jgi:phospholipase/lecithinase/hemolysin
VGQPGLPVYAPGRASNGPLAAELLSADFGVPLVNYAWAGATTGIGNQLDPGGTPTNLGAFGIPGMTTSFLATSASIAPIAPSALFLVWGGPNDFLRPSPLDSTPLEVANRAVANIVGLVQGLQVLGAKNILVPGMPDLGLTPSGQATGAAQLSAVSAYFNDMLRNSLPAGVRFYDTSALLHRVVQDPAAFGLTNVTGQCIDPTSATPTPCANPSQYLFWDDFHPTTRAHEILAQEFAQAAVPEPATFVLTGSVLVLCGLARRSRLYRVARTRRSVVQ